MEQRGPSAADSRPRARVIRDPVLGYVEVMGELDALVRAPEVQRLRNVAQNSRAVVRYPSMGGSRFEHALGTMHLAVRGWRSSWRNTVAPDGCTPGATRDAFRHDVITSLRELDPAVLDPRTAALVEAGETTDAEDTELWQDFEHVIGLVVGAVGLVHDLGHPPFSHILEPFYEAHASAILGEDQLRSFSEYRADASGRVQFHEWAGLRIFDAIDGSVFEWLPRTLIRRVLSDRSETGWASSLHHLIDGQFDVDRLDYLVRDAVNSGTEFGAIDVDRLLHSLELHRAEGGWRIGLGARAVSAFETLLVQRAQQYRWVVHHYAVVAADAALEHAVRNVYELTRGASAASPDLDYLSAAGNGHRAGDRVSDDHDCFAWLRRSRPALEALVASSEEPAVTLKARATLALLAVCDSFSLSPVPAWRNYQEFLARADQNRATVSRLIEALPIGGPTDAAHPRNPASRDAVTALLRELPARLNAALDHRLAAEGVPGRLHHVEELLDRVHPVVPVCGGPGTWLVVRVPFLALDEDFARVWRGDEEVALSEVSPFPLALTAIEVMRPRYFVYFVPFDAAPVDATKHQRREVGRLFFEALAYPSRH
ncbi:hypothetical protein [Nocardioides insulae]|uniref:hypothetical protein n=1 Tax=Nocardioides insulae TaxID=394734 RepID=UPI0004280BF6|nr:hypothetical protein [Nocardioides insulae]